METTRLIIVAVGGQGNLLASKVLGEAALATDIPVKMSEIHGMAQRGGVVESSMVFGPAQSTIISDGKADILVGFEPMETLRALGKCHGKTIVITNLSPLSPFTVTTGQGVYPEIREIQNLIREKTGKLITLNANALAEKAGNTMAVNMVLLGALISTRILPLSLEAVKQAIADKTRKAFVDVNLRAFDLGYEAAGKTG